MFFSRTALLRQDAINWLETLLGGAKIPPSTIRALGRLYFGDKIATIAEGIPDDLLLDFFKDVSGGLKEAFEGNAGLVRVWRFAFGFPKIRNQKSILNHLNDKYGKVLDDISNINEDFLKSSKVHLDLGGHNRYPDAVKIVTDPTDYNVLPIKNHIEGKVESFLPKFDSGSINKLTAESFSITSEIATEMKRVIQDGGEIGIMNSQSFVDQYVALFDDVTGSVSYGTFIDDFGIDYITAVITVAK